MSADQISEEEARRSAEQLAQQRKSRGEGAPNQAILRKRPARAAGDRKDGSGRTEGSGLIRRAGPSTMVLSAVNLDIPPMLDPPEAPEGVEPARQNDDEPTQMTERTAQLLGLMQGEQEDSEGDERPLGRGDLPEELFLTGEISRPELAEDDAIDDLGDAWNEVAPRVGEEAENEEVTRQSSLVLEQKLAADRARSAGMDSGEWGSLIDEVGFDGSFLDEKKPAKTEEESEPEEAGSDALPSLSEEEADAAFATLFGDEFEDEEEGDDGETSDAEDLAEQSEEDEEHHLILEEDSQTFDELHDELEPVVSDGYALPLPFEIRPTGPALQAGVVHSTYDEATKDHSFPRPEPKEPGVVIKRAFVLAPPDRVAQPPRAYAQTEAPAGGKKDRSKFIAAAVFLLIVAVIITFVLLSQ